MHDAALEDSYWISKYVVLPHAMGHGVGQLERHRSLSGSAVVQICHTNVHT